MRECKGRKPALSGCHPSSSRDEWVAHFECMICYAGVRVGKTYAREVATEALWDAYRSARKRPAANDSAAFCEWLMYFVYWRSRTFQTRKLREKKRALRLQEAKQVFLDDYVPSHSNSVHSRLTLAKALEVLSPEEKNLLCATYLLEYSSREVAEEWGVNNRTVQRQIASLTEHVRRRMADVRHGMTIFWPIRDTSSALRDFLVSTTRRLIRASRAIQHFGWCSMSVMMGGLVLGNPSYDPPAESAPSETPKLAAPSPRPRDSESASIAHFVLQPLFSSPTTVDGGPLTSQTAKKTAAKTSAPISSRPLANPDVPPVDTAVPEKPDTPPSVVAAPMPPISTAVVPPPQDSAPLPNDDQACFNAFSEAQAAFNYHDDAETCLAYLNQKPNGTDACPETIERKTLRRRCSDK